MPAWVRPLFVVTTLAVWAGVVFVMVWRGSVPDATFMGIPVAVFVAAAPPVTIGRGDSPTTERQEP
jgi:hypothetical protein